ncbi:hypothetical protein ACK6VR_18180, partial [Escherichia coli]
DRNRSHWSTSKTPSYTKSVSWQHHHIIVENFGDLHVHSKDLFYKQKNPTSPVFSGYVRFCLRMQ